MVIARLLLNAAGSILMVLGMLAAWTVVGWLVDRVCCWPTTWVWEKRFRLWAF